MNLRECEKGATVRVSNPKPHHSHMLGKEGTIVQAKQKKNCHQRVQVSIWGTKGWFVAEELELVERGPHR